MTRTPKDTFPEWIAHNIPGAGKAEFDIFIACADDGNGGDVTNGGAPLPTFDEWLDR